jgi:hypothetical protein
LRTVLDLGPIVTPRFTPRHGQSTANTSFAGQHLFIAFEVVFQAMALVLRVFE